MSNVIDNSKVSSIEKHDNRIRVSNYDLTRYGNERFLDLCAENPELPEVTRFTETDYFRVDFSGAYFDDIEFDNCTFTECNFEKAVFDDCGIYDCSFNKCNFTACTFDFCTSDEDWPIKNIEFVDCEGEFLTATYCNFENITMKNCNFKFLSIKDSRLSEFYANNCSMASACFDESAFDVVKFTGCDLTGINGEIAIIENGSEFRDCDITGSELRVKSLLIANSHKGIDIVNGTL